MERGRLIVKGILNKIILVSFIVLVVTSTIFILLFINEVKKGSNSSHFKTNDINLTNYTYSYKPIYYQMDLSKTNLIIVTNGVRIITNLALIVTPFEYSNLINQSFMLSNYMRQNITAEISNFDYLLLTHYMNSNVVKFPNLYQELNNEFGFGYTIKNRILLDYDYTLINTRTYDFGIGAFGLICITNLNDNDLGIKVINKW